MKLSIINVFVGSLFFTVMFLLYNLLFQDDMGVKEILLISFWISLGNEFLVPRLMKWSQDGTFTTSMRKYATLQASLQN